MRRITYPIVDVYLKNISSKKDKHLEKFANRNKLINFVREKWPVFEHYQFTMNSIVFCHKQIYPGNNGGTMVVEIFHDWSCKIYLPLGKYDSEEIDDINNFYESIGMQNIDKFPLIDAGTVCNALMCGLMVFEGVAKKYKLKEEDYAFGTEIENAGETIMCFGGERYKDYVREGQASYNE